MTYQLVGDEDSESSALLAAAYALDLPRESKWEDIESTANARGDSLLARAARLVQLQDENN